MLQRKVGTIQTGRTFALTFSPITGAPEQSGRLPRAGTYPGPAKALAYPWRHARPPRLARAKKDMTV